MSKRKKSRFGLLVVLGAVGYLGFLLFQQQLVLDSKADELNGLKAKTEEEKRLTEDLQKQKDMINSDEYIEKIAREKLGMVKQGEKVFVDAGN